MAIGVDADQSFAGDCVVTSALKPLELAVFETIKSAQEGTFEGGTDGSSASRSSRMPAARSLYGRRPAGGAGRRRRSREKLISGEIDPPATFGG